MKLVGFILAAILLSISVPSLAMQKFISIGTGGVTGIYYPAGSAICQMMARTRKEHNIRCSFEATRGSIYNVNAIRSGEFDFSIVQSDIQFKAYKGVGSFAGHGANTDLRSVFSIHEEPFTIVARSDKEITSFGDLRGKRVNIGNLGSGQRHMMDLFIDAFDWSLADFSLSSELRVEEQGQALCNDNIDAMVYTVGNPSGALKEVSTACNVVLLDVDGVIIDRFLAEHPYYRVATILGGMYRGHDRDVRTIGVVATLVTSVATPDDVVYTLVKSVFEELDIFCSLHQAFTHLNSKTMVHDGLSAPLHSGAIKYFREIGLID